MPGRWADSDRAARLPADWEERKAAVRKRDRGICYLCGQPGADTVDHVQPGDNHEHSNLAEVHDRRPPHCHRYKSAREGVDARAAIRAKRLRPQPRHPGLLEGPSS